jgi:hypothetical protein
VNSNTTNERAQVSRCAEPRLQSRMTDLTSESLWALGLAGGDGTRLQSLTHLIAGTPIPKQYCRMLGPRPLLETTLWRIAPLVAPERTLAIINRDHLAIARPQLTSLDARNVLVQPRSLDTGPGVLVSMRLSVVGEAATCRGVGSEADISACTRQPWAVTLFMPPLGGRDSSDPDPIGHVPLDWHDRCNSFAD